MLVCVRVACTRLCVCACVRGCVIVCGWLCVCVHACACFESLHVHIFLQRNKLNFIVFLGSYSFSNVPERLRFTLSVHLEKLGRDQSTCRASTNRLWTILVIMRAILLSYRMINVCFFGPDISRKILNSFGGLGGEAVEGEFGHQWGLGGPLGDWVATREGFWGGLGHASGTADRFVHRIKRPINRQCSWQTLVLQETPGEAASDFWKTIARAVSQSQRWGTTPTGGHKQLLQAKPRTTRVVSLSRSQTRELSLGSKSSPQNWFDAQKEKTNLKARNASFPHAMETKNWARDVDKLLAAEKTSGIHSPENDAFHVRSRLIYAKSSEHLLMVA